MEDGLGGLGQLAGCEKIFTVLILVLVEDGLGAAEAAPKEARLKSLNPCFSGGWSRRAQRQPRIPPRQLS